MRTNNEVKKQTLYISIVVSLLIGFLTGIIFSDRDYGSSGDANAYSSQNNTNDAADQLAQQINSLELEVATNPDNTSAWIQLGNNYFDTDQPQKAINAYTKSLELSPGNPNVLTDLGVMYRRNGQPEKALESFQEASGIDPQHEQSRFNTGIVLLYDMNKKQGALEVWQDLLQINPAATVSGGRSLQEIVDELQMSIN